jgi:hypothetical protein
MDTHILSMRKMNGHTVKIAPALLVLAIALLQPAPEAFADVSVQDKEVLAAVDKVAPTVEEIAKKLWELSEVSLLEIIKPRASPRLLSRNTERASRNLASCSSMTPCPAWATSPLRKKSRARTELPPVTAAVTTSSVPERWGPRWRSSN